MFTYYDRQENMIDEGSVEVSYPVSRRRGCATVMAYEYYKTLANAKRRAITIAQESGICLVADFAGYSEVFRK